MQSREILLETTAAEYSTFLSNKYHPLHYSGISKLQAIKDGQRYFFLINYFKDVYPSPLEVANGEAIRRVDCFCDVLIAKKFRPSVISICRSAKSGYTKPDQASAMQEELIRGLCTAFHLGPAIHIEQVLPKDAGQSNGVII